MAARAAAEAAEADAAAEEEEGDGDEPGGRFAAAAAAGDAGSGWDTGLLPSPVGGSKEIAVNTHFTNSILPSLL